VSSKNNIYSTAENQPVMKYFKPLNIAYIITGWRLDPETNKRVYFILESAPVPANTKYEDLTKRTFSYEDDVIELYSEREVRFFRQQNKYLFERGLLQEFEGEPEEIDTSNMLSDPEVVKIALLPQAKLSERLQDITSPITLSRIYNMMLEIGRPAKITSFVKAKLEVLEKHE